MAYVTTCTSCARSFDAAHPSARTCSAACRQALVRGRRRASERAAVDRLRAGLKGDPVALAVGLADALSLIRAA